MDEKRVSKNRERKEKIVAEIADKVARSKALVLTNYQGMTHKQLEELKKALKAANAEIVVTKNTLLKRTLEQAKNNVPETSFNQPTATLFAYDDPITPLKELAKSIRLLKLPLVKLGIFEGNILSENDVVKLSTLPPRDVLLAQFVGGLKAPLYGLHRALNWNLQKLVLTLHAVQKTKAS